MVYKVAITGGIGSGKSTFANILRAKGYTVFSCDEIYKDLLSDEKFVKEICESFDISPSLVDGRLTLNKDALSKIVFSDKAALEKLNSITHPRIMDNLMKKIGLCSGLVFAEVPLLFEGGYQHLFDDVVIITRDLDKRICGVVKRDKVAKQAVVERITSQYDYDKCANSKYITVVNNFEIDNLICEADKLIDRFNFIDDKKSNMLPKI